MLNLPLVCCKLQSSMKRSQGTIDLTLTKVKEGAGGKKIKKKLIHLKLSKSNHPSHFKEHNQLRVNVSLKITKQ